MSEPKNCFRCGGELTVMADYIGGGSHYWSFWCKSCNRVFYYDTYRFKMEEIDSKDAENSVQKYLLNGKETDETIKLKYPKVY